MSSIRHEVIPVVPGVFCISEFKLVNAFLVIGQEKAALIDTANGIGNIGAVVKTLTDRPLEVLLTHNHADHIGGLYTLPGVPVFVHPADRELLFPCNNNFRRMYIESRGPIRFPGEGHQEAMLALVPEQEQTITLENARLLAEGDVFDLGGRALEVLHTPGHSAGSVCYLDARDRILFSGDTVNNSIILMRQPGNGTALIEQYNRTLCKLWARAEEYDCLAIGHDGVTVPKQIVRDYLDLTRGLLDGSMTGRYEEVGFRKGEVARRGLAELWYQCDA